MKSLLSKVAVLTALSGFFYSAEADTPCPPTVCLGADCTPSQCFIGEPVFEGYGTSSTFGGGPGSQVCTVTTLANSGAGTLRNCVENRSGPEADPVPLTVEFAVEGTILLTSDLLFRQPYLTIDGLSAPGQGITLAKSGNGENGETHVTTWSSRGTCGHDVLVQGLRLVGVWDGSSTAHSQNAGLLTIDGSDLPGCVNNVVIWRNTYVSGQDAVGQLWGSIEDATFAYNLLINNNHPQSISHFPGGVDGQERKRISIHHNIYAYNQERLPNIRGNVWDTNFEQNIIHKWGAFFPGGYATRFRCRNGGCPMRINMIGNQYTSAGSQLGSAILFQDGASPDQVYWSQNRVPSSELDVGTAPAAFPRSDTVTLFSESELVAKMFPFVGQPSRTFEEAGILNEIDTQFTAQ